MHNLKKSLQVLLLTAVVQIVSVQSVAAQVPTAPPATPALAVTTAIVKSTDPITVSYTFAEAKGDVNYPTSIQYYIAGPQALGLRTSTNLSGSFSATPSQIFGQTTNVPDGTYYVYFNACNVRCSNFVMKSFTVQNSTTASPNPVQSTSVPTVNIAAVLPANVRSTDTFTVYYTLGNSPSYVEYYITGPETLATAQNPRRSTNVASNFSASMSTIFGKTVKDGFYTMYLRACNTAGCSNYFGAAIGVDANVVPIIPKNPVITPPVVTPNPPVLPLPAATYNSADVLQYIFKLFAHLQLLIAYDKNPVGPRPVPPPSIF
jgi:hypothetical protein